MPDTQWIHQQAERTILRLLPRIKPLFEDNDSYTLFTLRMQQHFPRAFQHLYHLYGQQYDFFYHLENTVQMLAALFIQRPADLRTLDAEREAEPLWFKHERMIGGVCYVDLFAGNLEGVREKISYFKELGLTYLHLMPLFQVPAENNDGGYAVSDFRTVRPDLGTMDELALLARDLRAEGISLVVDFVFNHTSDEHAWAKRALAGETQYQEFYYMFPDRTLPDQYEANLREIFPEQAPGSFTYRAEVDRWVWTTFNNFQWDLNYSNPEVFTAMLEEMLFLANQGVEVLRLDAVAFVWKRLGTSSENQPEAHEIIRAFNALTHIVAPAVLFKSEAIVHPDDVASYIAWEECPISYNPTYMALLWEALATREVKLLRHSMSKRFDIPAEAAWVNYIRVHDDIGWSFADEDAAEVGILGFDHRQFLNRFYTGQFQGTFATGVPFNFNPETLDTRISGTAASLAGLEQALQANNDRLIDLALGRLIMLHSLIIAAGGIPLLYLGDEIATTNDYSYRSDPVKSADSRWVHRPRFDWERAERRHDQTTPEGRLFQAVQRMINIRKTNPVFADGMTLFFDTLNPHVFGFLRNRQMLVLANFSEREQNVQWAVLNAYWRIPAMVKDLMTEQGIAADQPIVLQPYQFIWLVEG
ncbi:MAG: alpha-amylase family glycosyl hydrolase [Anaerolineae bacterium]